jgi:hypothetical protein
MLHCKLSEQTCESQIDLWVGAFGEYAQVSGASQLVSRIDLWDTDALELQDVESVVDAQAFQSEPDHALVEIEFLSRSVSSSIDDDLGLVACIVEDGELGRWRGRGAFDAPQANTGNHSQFRLRTLSEASGITPKVWLCIAYSQVMQGTEPFDEALYTHRFFPSCCCT